VRVLGGALGIRKSLVSFVFEVYAGGTGVDFVQLILRSERIGSLGSLYCIILYIFGVY
jgi:hypothetical protein